MDLKINHESDIPKYHQIATRLTDCIEAGVFKVGGRLPSIDVVSQQNQVAKQTVVMAYKQLKQDGLVEANKKRGIYVKTNITEKRIRILVLFNVMSPSKEIIYTAFLKALPENAQVELFFHNNNLEIFENIIRNKLDKYHYFVVMPHHAPAAVEILKIIPPSKLIVLDKPLKKTIQGTTSIHQDFKADVFDALTRAKKSVLKYKRIFVLFPNGKHLPGAITDGIKTFGRLNELPVKVISTMEPKYLMPGSLYITLTDELLISFFELIQEKELILGKQVGVISYNESPLKKILFGGIATLSSDFGQMGKTAAAAILNKKVQVVRNPFHLLLRPSF